MSTTKQRKGHQKVECLGGPYAGLKFSQASPGTLSIVVGGRAGRYVPNGNGSLAQLWEPSSAR